VADFGLSRLVKEHQAESPLGKPCSVWGTPAYMAPEAFDGVATHSGDVWSFGCLLWQMVTGQAPHTGLLPAQIMAGQMDQSLHLAWPEDIHPGLRQLGLACLQHDPGLRPPFRWVVTELSLIESRVRLDLLAQGISTPHLPLGKGPSPAASLWPPEADNSPTLSCQPTAALAGMQPHSEVQHGGRCGDEEDFSNQ
ncbi:hypothetical protein QJQ45_027652, partial [Haematococcus lacustris]